MANHQSSSGKIWADTQREPTRHRPAVLPRLQRECHGVTAGNADLCRPVVIPASTLRATRIAVRASAPADRAQESPVAIHPSMRTFMEEFYYSFRGRRKLRGIAQHYDA